MTVSWLKKEFLFDLVCVIVLSLLHQCKLNVFSPTRIYTKCYAIACVEKKIIEAKRHWKVAKNILKIYQKSDSET